MMLSKCCAEHIKLVETPDTSYYACVKCSTPTKVFSVIELLTFGDACNDEMIPSLH